MRYTPSKVAGQERKHLQWQLSLDKGTVVAFMFVQGV